ncbi:MAG: hypothetical protein PHV13_04185 [Candidatus ainarchaeum sp.]|nr:hypothetical protein [Candidatus ainarchaeum sp.]
MEALKYLTSVLSGGLETESRLVNYSLASAAVLVLLGSIGYWALSGDAGAYVPLALLAIGSSVAMVCSCAHALCYRQAMACMHGMMAGMTLGMAAGFMVGALLGATNGMFMGSVAGMAAGIGLGTSLGRCTGVMGAMEGVMAGLMSGVMGAMTSVMMLNDHLVGFLFLLFVLCALVLGSLGYMLYRENGAAPPSAVKFHEFLAASMILSVLMVAVIIWGPKGPITYP